MKFAEILLKAWTLRRWMGLCALVALAVAVASLTVFKSTVYASASTQMLVDSPQSALGDSRTDLTGFTARAVVYARLMTTPEALAYIGQAAGVPGNLIEASGPTELDGPNAVHAPTALHGGQVVSPTAAYKLNFDQNPELPTVDIYADAPTVRQAIALANGAVKGFGTYVDGLENQTGVPASQRVEVRQLGSATGGIVDPSSAKTIAILIFCIVFLVGALVVFFVHNLRDQLRLARRQGSGIHDLERDADGFVTPSSRSVLATPSRSVASPIAPQSALEHDAGGLKGANTEATRRAVHSRRRNGKAEEKVSGDAHISP
jgi:hypothetical protein